MPQETSGSLTATGSVTLVKDAHNNSVLAQISGTFTGTSFVFEGTIDGTNWFALVASDMSNGQYVGGTISPTDTVTYGWLVRSEACTSIRARVTSGPTGSTTATFTLQSGSLAGPFVSIAQTTSATTFSTGALTVTAASTTALAVGRLGTTTPAFQVDSTTGGTTITGLKIVAGATGAGCALSLISSSTNENLTVDAKGSGTISLNVTGTGNIVLGRAATGVSLAVTAGITSSGATGAGIGYATGAGGAVTQITSRTTGVTLNTLCGSIQTDVSSLAAGAEAEFTVTNSTVAATDTVIVCLKTESTTGTSIPYVSTVGAGSFKITLSNLHASTADTSASVINFVVIKAVAA